MDSVYGKTRAEELPVLKSVVEILRKYGLRSGLHGTSLWNPKYSETTKLLGA